MVLWAGVGRGFLAGGIHVKSKRVSSLKRESFAFMRMKKPSGGKGALYLSVAGGIYLSGIGYPPWALEIALIGLLVGGTAAAVNGKSLFRAISSGAAPDVEQVV